MADDYGRIVNAEDSEIVYNAVTREVKADLSELITEYDKWIKSNLLVNAIKVQWRIVQALTVTLAKVERRALLMERDYKGRNK